MHKVKYAFIVKYSYIMYSFIYITEIPVPVLHRQLSSISPSHPTGI